MTEDQTFCTQENLRDGVPKADETFLIRLSNRSGSEAFQRDLLESNFTSATLLERPLEIFVKLWKTFCPMDIVHAVYEIKKYLA